GLASPVATDACRAALETLMPQHDRPRSWRKDAFESFATLPIEVRAELVRRDHEREKEVRRLQNELATLRKRLPAAADATKAATSKEESLTMAKKDAGWNDDPQGGGKPGFDRTKNYTPYTQGKDISEKAEKAADIDGGFAGKLPK